MIRTIDTRRTTMGAAMLGLLLPVLGAAAEEPAWLAEARAREGKLVDARSFKSKDGVLTGQVPGKLRNKVVLEDQVYYVEVDIGTDTPVSCEVLVEGFDLARMLRSTANLTFERLAELQGAVDAKTVERVDAGVMGANAYIAVDWVYRTQTSKGPMLGGLKQVAVDMHSYGVYCSHVDLGYARTFASVVQTLVGSLRYADAPAAPDFLEVQTLRLGDQPVGVATWKLETDADGDVRSLLANSMFVPAAEGAVTAQDTVHVQWMKPDGRMLNAMHVSSSNDETQTQLELRPAADSEKWRVSGTFMGKPLEADLGEETPASVLTQARLRRDLLADSSPVGKKLTDQSWTSADPTRLLTTTFTVTGRDATGRFTATEVSGPLKVEEVLDAATGTPLRMTMAVGPASLLLERVYVSGTL
ncbi:MAG TPA: hypothetical protein VFI92_16065 [Steroidobacteraceae bacterium]|nr:hypothetical protein [Steroidobacteraceae bacterium]